MWNSELFASFFAILHSALCIPHLKCPPGPRNEERLGFCTQRPCPRAGHPTEATFGWCPFIIRSERCTHFQAIGSAGLISFLINRDCYDKNKFPFKFRKMIQIFDGHNKAMKFSNLDPTVPGQKL
jgi:hypothetical protein